MADPGRAIATQIANIERKTGKDMAQLRAEIATCGKAKHGEIRNWLVDCYGMGFGDANALTLQALKSNGSAMPSDGRGSHDGELDEIYSGRKAHLRLIHDRLMEAINRLGQFEIAPKKGYLSLRRKRQFAMLGPKSNDRIELGINLKEEVVDPRFMALPPGGMCQFMVRLRSPEDVDGALVAIIRRAYEGSA